MRSVEGRRGQAANPARRSPRSAACWGKPTNNQQRRNVGHHSPHHPQGRGLVRVDRHREDERHQGVLPGREKSITPAWYLSELPFGTTLLEMIFEVGGGIPNGKKFPKLCKQVVHPAASFRTNISDIAVEYESLQKLGSIMGSGAWL